MPAALDDLVPVPQRVEPLSGRLNTQELRWAADAASLEQTAIAYKLGVELQADVDAGAALPAHTVTVGDPPLAGLQPPDRAQGYALLIAPEGAAVRGRDADGLYWGLVTLEQLLSAGPELPCARIADWPAFPLRGHHDDISRGQVSRPADFCRIIRTLSRYKINIYTPYMEDLLYLKSYPDIGEHRGRLTPDEVCAMHLEAARHSVTIMPTYSLIGHQESLLSNPKYACLGREVFQCMSSLDVRKPQVRVFLRNVIRDVCELFPSPYFHAGFDETQGIDAQEFLDHANWCARELKAHGKQMAMWVDMIYNHFGYDMIRRLEENVIPVNWEYDCTDGEVPHQRELTAQGRPVWGLAGYGGGKFLPDFARGKANIDTWVKVGRETNTPAIFASQWGDYGTENHRDMRWNMFAYLGEATWSGERARREDFEHRFQRSFYGEELPPLTDVIERLPGRLNMGVGPFWTHFRRNAFATARWAVQEPDADAGLAADEGMLTGALEAVADAQTSARLEVDQLDHFRVALMRMLSVTRRLRFALRRAAGLDREEVRQLCRRTVEMLDSIRDAYTIEWLRNNKWQGMEESLRVYDDVMLSYELLPDVQVGEGGPRGGFYLLGLAGHFNTCFLPVAGLPIGEQACNGVPFLFADERHTHVAMKAGAAVELDSPLTAVKDVHLVMTAPRGEGQPEPLAMLELLRDGEVVHAEEMQRVLHLCDWWAPRGEHIWAGGGMAHVDPARVRYALRPGHLYGLTHLSGFRIPQGTHADALRLRALKDEVQLFAATLETEE
jgi:hypothetical protein